MLSLSAKERVRCVADRQNGRVSAAQLAAIGIKTVVVSQWVRQGYLIVELPRVYAVGHRAKSVEADLVAAVLYAGPGATLRNVITLLMKSP